MPALKTVLWGLGQDALIQRGRPGWPTQSAAMITRLTKVTIETEGIVVVRQGRIVMTWCPGCQAEVEVILCDEDFIAQLQAGIGLGSLHVWRPPFSSPRICSRSLLQASRSSEVQPPPIPERKLTKEGEGQ